MSIHPAAIVHPGAEIHATAEIGPYVVIEDHVRIGANTRIGPYVHLFEGVVIGENNAIHSHAVIGDKPQHLAYDGKIRPTVIGNNNTIREHVTVHRPFAADGETRIGDGCLLMVNSHVGHDCVVGNGVILTNGVLLAGHVTVGEKAIFSGNSAAHQFVRIGRLAMLQGLAGVSKDVLPFLLMSAGINRVAGMNVIGLRRAGMNQTARNEIKQAYRILFREGRSLPGALEKLKASSFGPEVQEMIAFIESSKRGICLSRGRAEEE